MASAVKVTMSGPLFDGKAEAAVPALLDDIEQTIGQQVVNEVRRELGRVLRHPTGYYQRHIQTDRQRDDSVVADGRVRYGPWLEGVSSRNKRSRFKGYQTFRRVTQRMQQQAAEAAEDVLPKHIRRMGGGR